ncbi:uncharacterized protein LOC124278479 [Haliotis rubra]|uniref:uncharacterized protein LOC124278479 n=1 Tax=Haliotis rubra TaxID=36100 RepID=UPI001EE583AB|nr:uncharacterized protein LOC124278479 [Haliotis rubra]
MVEIEVVKFRPIKLLAVIFTGIALLLLIISIAAADWVDVKFTTVKDGWRSWGLWEECYEITSSLRACVKKDLDVSMCSVDGSGLDWSSRSFRPRICGLCTHKRLISITGFKELMVLYCLVAAVFILISVIIFPVKFSEDIMNAHRGDMERWDIDWTYGVAFGGLLFLLGAAIFFFLKQENQEVSREKTSMPEYYNNSY